MKQIAKNIVNGISNIENYIFNTDQENMVTELFQNYMNNIKSNYWKNLVVLEHR